MSFHNLNLKYVYDSDQDDILNEFYIPALSQSISYKRLAGSFSSSAFAVAAKGISKLIQNGGSMQLVAGAELRPSDVDAIMQGLKKKEEVIADIMIKDLESIEDEFVKDHVKALAWMVANNKLQIKIAVVLEDGKPLDKETVQLRGIFHPKIGILEDKEGNTITFSGSINESLRGWLYNDEYFHVFPNWIEAFKQIVDKDLQKFETCWNGLPNRFIVLDVPTAYSQHLIKLAPAKIEELNLEKWYIKASAASTKETIRLRDYQERAVKNWISKGGRGLFEMATGTGKTHTAIACMKEQIKTHDKLATIITVPYKHLIPQWQKNLSQWGFKAIEVFGEIPDWKRKLGNEVIDLNDGVSKNLIIITTHDTFSSKQFVEIIEHITPSILLIADEVHAVGSEIRKQGLVENYKYRLGLSATPRRYFDDEGTLNLLEYFGETVIKFDLRDAIDGKYLVPYEYHPHYVELSPEELEEYRKFSRKIAIQWSMAKDEHSKKELEGLLEIQRQKIIVNAELKMTEFGKILDLIGDKLHHCLIYCSERQIDRVQHMLNQRVVINQKITFREDLRERSKYLQKFDEGIYNTIVAINCLDEGVDIPSTHMVIILASTGNPKQYIQRRGRILRPYAGKEKAIIYDILVVPTIHGDVDEETYDLERKIVQKELMRHEEMSNIALNREEALNRIAFIKKKYRIQ
jgi:superfamily II DNA or RNA helicase